MISAEPRESEPVVSTRESNTVALRPSPFSPGAVANTNTASKTANNDRTAVNTSVDSSDTGNPPDVDEDQEFEDLITSLSPTVFNNISSNTPVYTPSAHGNSSNNSSSSNSSGPATIIFGKKKTTETSSDTNTNNSNSNSNSSSSSNDYASKYHVVDLNKADQVDYTLLYPVHCIYLLYYTIHYTIPYYIHYTILYFTPSTTMVGLCGQGQSRYDCWIRGKSGETY